MSAHLPQSVIGELIPSNSGLKLVNRGKVRDTYRLPGPNVHDERLLQVATDRVSIFDFVLPAVVPHKGAVLTAISHFWMTALPADIPTHFDPEGVLAFRLFNQDFPQERCLVVKPLTMYPWEFIWRRHLGGSVWKDYAKRSVVAGSRLKKGYRKWQQLRHPLFTPSTKATEGHDANVTQQRFWKTVGLSAAGQAPCLTQRAYEFIYRYGRSKGLVFLDIKFEVGQEGYAGGFDIGKPTIADEVGTPDCCRITTASDLEAALREERDPYFYDKQFVREWGLKVETPFGVTGINNLDPCNPEHLEFVDQLVVPNDVVTETSDRYLQLPKMLTNMSLREYQEDEMGIPPTAP